MKKIIVIGGPNGAGKTTFASEFLPHEACCPEFLNADLIAAGISPFQPELAAFTAGRLMLSRISDLAASGKNFAFETTLATRLWHRMIPDWQAAGYRIKLYYLKLPDPEMAVERVRQRVALGGHHIPEDTIRRRFARSWENFQRIYRGLVDVWSVYDARSAPVSLLESGSNPTDSQLMEDSPHYSTESDTTDAPPPRAKPLDDPDFIGAEAAFKRAAAKAIARARAAGLEPVVRPPLHPPSSDEG